SAATSGVTANPADPDSVVADGVQTSTITVVVRDQYGNPVPGDTVTLAATGTGNTIAQPTARTDANGTATGTIASTAAETKTVTATSGGSLALEQTASVKFYAGLVNGANSDVTVLPDTALANAVDSITIIVTVKDNNSNPVPGQTVQIAVSGSGNTVTQPASTTDALGVATGSVKSTKAESKTVSLPARPARQGGLRGAAHQRRRGREHCARHSGRHPGRLREYGGHGDR
ncbi:MAG: Ig-like domain-containing protein, partial [Gemmatimonadetes bacterium]|nr:Ig-like domain-containing protein [Gemmatimonadota bacterium]